MSRWFQVGGRWVNWDQAEVVDVVEESGRFHLAVRFGSGVTEAVASFGSREDLVDYVEAVLKDHVTRRVYRHMFAHMLHLDRGDRRAKKLGSPPGQVGGA